MSDIFSNDAAWLKLCHSALCERDPLLLLTRIAAARSTVINLIERDFPNLSSAEGIALHDALDMLMTLQDIAEAEIDEPKTGT